MCTNHINSSNKSHKTLIYNFFNKKLILQSHRNHTIHKILLILIILKTLNNLNKFIIKGIALFYYFIISLVFFCFLKSNITIKIF